jgi:hypothetical protein
MSDVDSKTLILTGKVRERGGGDVRPSMDPKDGQFDHEIR